MNKREKSELLTIANEEKAKRAAELVIANKEKAKREDELVIAKADKAEREDELVIAKEEKAKREDELVIAKEEKAKRADELVTANEEKAKRAAELVIAEEEKAKRAAELFIAEKEKAKRAAELVIANSEKAKRAAEFVIANSEKAKRAAELIIADLKKEKRADELIIANKKLTYQNEEKAKRAAELVIADILKTKREAELVIIKIDKAKRIAKSIIADKELSFQTEEKSKRAAEFVIAEAEKEKLAAELVIANIKKAKRSAELVIANVEKAKRSAELVIANKELVYQKSEKSKREAELIIANVEKAKRKAELVIANIEKAKRAAELVATNKELVLATEKAKLTAELIILNKELTHQIEKRKQSESELIKTKEKAEESEYNLKERVKEISGLFSLGLLTEKFENLEDIYNEFVKIVVPNSMQFPDKVYVALEIADKKYVNIENFNLSINNETLSTPIKIFGKHSGTLTVSYTANLPFIEIHEQNLINAYGERVSKITENVKTKQDLKIVKEKAEENNRLKTAFLQNISHEIRTPMNGILGFSELLKRPDLTSEKQQEFIKIIRESGERMLDTINNIVDISKIEAGLMSVYISESNINQQIEFLYNFFTPLTKSKGLQLSFNNGLPPNESIIKTDSGKMSSILTNLVGNAIRFTKEGSIEFGYEKKGKYLEFFVKDTGIGIPKDRLVAIFERFIKADIEDKQAFQGSGLGLTISKSYVEMLGGEIWIESQEGKGTTFYFTIPYNAVLEEKNLIGNAVTQKDEEVEIKNLKILIVEDDEISYLWLSEALQEISHKIIHAETGVEAIDACRNNSDLDLIAMDVRMPEMDGYEATRQIRLFNTDVIIIAQTAHAFAVDIEKAIEAGCNDYISKPIDMTLLHALIKKHCNN